MAQGLPLPDGPGNRSNAAETALQRALVAHTTDLVAVISASGTFLSVNPSYERVLAYSPADLLGSSVFSFLDGADLERMQQALSAIETSDYTPVPISYRFLHADGSWRDFEAVAVNHLSDPGIEGFVLTSRVVTNQDRTNEALAGLLEMAGSLVSLEVGSADDADVTGTEVVAQQLVTLTAHILDCTRVTITAIELGGRPRAVAAIGLTRDQETVWRSGLPNTSLREFLNQDELERLNTTNLLIVDADPQRRLPYGVSTLLLVALRTGSRLAGVLALDHGGVPHHYSENDLVLARAVATLAGLVLEHERLLREHADASAAAFAMREANRRIEAFLAVVGHELKTPLTSIGGNLQVAQRRLQRLAEGDLLRASEIAPLLAGAYRGLRRMSRMVDELLDMAALGSGQLQLAFSDCDLALIVHTAIEEQSSLTPARRIVFEPPVEQLPPIHADSARLSQVVGGYLSNAYKFSLPQSPITVSITREGSLARVRVSDWGEGIVDEDRERIWNRFFRGEGVEHQDGSSVGLGLGLYLIRAIVEGHGGQVGVDSSYGAGAVFWFTVPLNLGASNRVRTQNPGS